MRVDKLLESKGDYVVTCPPGTLVGEAVALMQHHTIGAVVIANGDDRFVGLCSEREIAHGLATWGADLLTLQIDRLANRAAPTCSLQDDVAQVMARMSEERTRHMPIVEYGALRGIISIGDLVKHRLHELETESRHLRSYIVGAEMERMQQ